MNVAPHIDFEPRGSAAENLLKAKLSELGISIEVYQVLEWLVRQAMSRQGFRYKGEPAVNIKPSLSAENRFNVISRELKMQSDTKWQGYVYGFERLNIRKFKFLNELESWAHKMTLLIDEGGQIGGSEFFILSQSQRRDIKAKLISKLKESASIYYQGSYLNNGGIIKESEEHAGLVRQNEKYRYFFYYSQVMYSVYDRYLNRENQRSPIYSWIDFKIKNDHCIEGSEILNESFFETHFSSSQNRIRNNWDSSDAKKARALIDGLQIVSDDFFENLIQISPPSHLI